MREKELSEIRRRLKPEKSNISHVMGCYVNEKKEVIAMFDQSLGLMTQGEAEKYLTIFKRTLSGQLGKNLLDICFTTKQVADSDEHRLLMALKNSGLKDQEAAKQLFQKIVETLVIEGNYLILLMCDSYDVPFRSRDGERQEDASSEVFQYILCSVCPVKLTKAALSYYTDQNEFHDRPADWVVGAPQLGFMFPAFDDRSTNIYNALYYTHDTTQNHPELIDALFRREAPMPASVQKETFQGILSETLSDDCSLEVVQAVHEQLSQMIEVHKLSKEEDPLQVNSRQVKRVLEDCGVAEEKAARFEEKYQAEFGEDATLSPRNIVDVKQFEVSTPDVVIRVNPERSDLVETRVIDGCRYILIAADEGVEVNGVRIHIPKE